MTRIDQTPQHARPDAITGQDDPEIKAAGRLVYGVPYEGRRHYDFCMRLPTMGENIDALEAYPDASGARIDLVMFAACMERLGDIPVREISYELLAQIDPADVDVIYQQLAEAKKKRRLLNTDCALSENSSLSSASTASPSGAPVA